MIFHKYQKCTRAKKSKITMVHKYQQCTRTYFLGQMIGHSLKNIFDSLGFAYDFAFCQNNGSLKIFQNVSWTMSLKMIKYTNLFWEVGPNKYQKQIGVWWSKFDKILKFHKVKIICFKDVPIYFLIFVEVFWYKKSYKYGVHGPRNDQ